ncbi:hypothetical protein A6A29_38710 [Streptomyces sp. TSRI0281]|nr:nucleotidyltransferase family protein [Streptomyces sp. TSRI0281]OKI40729.1 hypothetical protein A6A29_38710 [Streptomyces sp. TSRI0281]
MAGGLGTRLMPVTSVLPKVLAPVGSRALLDYVLDSIEKAGLTRVSLLLGNHAGLVEAYVASHAGQWPSLVITPRRDTGGLGTAAPLRELDEDRAHLLVLNGDLLTDVDLGEIVGEHLRGEADVTVAGAVTETSSPFAVLHADDDDVLWGLEEKPVDRKVVAVGIYLLAPSARMCIRSQGADDMPNLIERAIGQGLRVRQYLLPTGSVCCDIGEPDRFMEAQTLAARMSAPDSETGLACRS